MQWRIMGGVVFLFVLVCGINACEETQKPPTAHTIVLKGSAYDRGFEHGKTFSSHIHSIYTRLLTSSIIPYLNREQMNIAPILNKYKEVQFLDGRFSYQMMLESGKLMYDYYIPDEYREEMRGIADGSGLSLDEVIVLNTFYDTMMGFRAVVTFIQNIQEPVIRNLEVTNAADTDTIDNNGDGQVDEADEWLVEPYLPSPYATLVEVPLDAEFRFLLDDPRLGGMTYIDPRNTEPFGEMVFGADCIDETCLSPECSKQSGYPLECLDPRYREEGCYSDVCFDNDCAPREVIPDCYDGRCLKREKDDCAYLSHDSDCYQSGCMSEECIPHIVEPDCYSEACFADQCMPLRDQIVLYPRLNISCLKESCVQNSDPGCVNKDSIRIRVDQTQYTIADGSITTRQLEEEQEGGLIDSSGSECKGPLEVIFRPPGGLPPAAEVTLLIQASDMSPIYSPEPYHNRNMRDERIVITTKGYAEKYGKGQVPREIGNRGVSDSSMMPPSISFAARGSATPDGDPILAHHFSLLDNDMMHEHSLLQIHVPENGTPHAFLGWTGLVWGFSGMNSEGLAYAVNNSDSLDNPLVGRTLDAIFENIGDLIADPNLEGLAEALQSVRLLASGTAIGFAARELLQNKTTVDEGIHYLHSIAHTYGWNVLLADAEGGLAAVEIDAGTQSTTPYDPDVLGERDGFYYYTPDDSNPQNLDAQGQRWSSVGPDDLRMASHYRKNIEDMEEIPLMQIFSPRQQYKWTGFYFRSLRSYYILGDRIEEKLGSIDVSTAIDILRTPELVDTRDSMSSVVFEPAKKRFHWAMGDVPATGLPYEPFDFSTDMEGGTP